MLCNMALYCHESHIGTVTITSIHTCKLITLIKCVFHSCFQISIQPSVLLERNLLMSSTFRILTQQKPHMKWWEDNNDVMKPCGQKKILRIAMHYLWWFCYHTNHVTHHLIATIFLGLAKLSSLNSFFVQVIFMFITTYRGSFFLHAYIIVVWIWHKHGIHRQLLQKPYAIQEPVSIVICYTFLS